MIILLALLGCDQGVEEIDVIPEVCRVLSSEPTEAVPEVVELIPTTLDVSRAGVVPLEEGTRWSTLRGSFSVDTASPAYTIEREGPTLCPTVVRTPFLGVLGVDDGTTVFDVSGWVETTAQSGSLQLESFRLGGRQDEGEDADTDAVRGALEELAHHTLRELRPDLEVPTVQSYWADVYIRGDADAGELGVVVRLVGGHSYRGPMLSGEWSAPAR